MLAICLENSLRVNRKLVEHESVPPSPDWSRCVDARVVTSS